MKFLLITLCILICFLPVFWFSPPENEIKIPGTVSVYNHITGEISQMKLKEYTARCVAGEMPASFHFEALKAQAVAVRSYTLSKKPSEEHKGALVCTDFNHCMAFLQNDEKLLPVFLNASEETEGQVLVFDGKIANTVFHAMSSGRTENAKDVWGGNVPYLVSVDCKSDRNEENYKTVKEFAWEEIYKLLEICQKEIGKPEKTKNGMVKSVKIGEKIFTGTEVRKLLSLRSSSFDLEKTKDGVRFTCYGYGHGVGMSQYGADEFARSGMDYKEILQHFYKGTELISIDFGA